MRGAYAVFRVLHEFIQLFRKADEENERKRKVESVRLQKQQEAEARKKHALEKARMLAEQEKAEGLKLREEEEEEEEMEARGGAILPYSQEEEDPGGVSPPNGSPRAGVAGGGAFGAKNAAELLRQKFMRVTSKSEDSDSGSDFSNDDDSLVSAEVANGMRSHSLGRTVSLPPPHRPPSQKAIPYVPRKGPDELALRHSRTTDVELRLTGVETSDVSHVFSGQ